MKTRAKSVVVEVTDNGRLTRRRYPIADKDGNLMTNRLRRLITGKLGRSDYEDERNIHFVGMVWDKPYIILNELMAERLLLQSELILRGYHGALVLVAPRSVPESASDDTITNLVLHELKLHDKIKNRLRQLK